jgi:hypothetical protein
LATALTDGFGFAMPPGDHDEPFGMPGMVETGSPLATNPSRNASWNGPQEPKR